MSNLHLRNNLEKFSLQHDRRLKNLKYLAEDMVRILMDKKRKESEEQHYDETLFYDVDVQTAKHKSQIFYNRNHHQMLKNFSLSRSSEEATNRNVKRKKVKQITGKKKIDYEKNTIKFHLSINQPEQVSENIKNVNINNEEQQKDENKLKIKSDSGDNNSNINDEKEKENLYQEEYMNSGEVIEYDSNDLINDKDINENYEICYIDPRVDTKEREELSTKNEENNIENGIKGPKRKKNKGILLFERGIKLLNLKDNKIKKAKEISENKTKGFFDVKNFMNRTPNNHKIKNTNKKKYIPLQYKAEEIYKSHLARIEINKRSNLIKKKIEENKQMEFAQKVIENTKKRFSGKSWNNFIKREKAWKENKRINREKSLNNKYKSNVYDRPKINKNSIIILEQKKEKNKLNNKHIETTNSIYTKLYLDKEVYDNKLKIRIHNSTPSFTPTINKNKKQKKMKYLNDISLIQNNNLRNKTMINKHGINNINLSTNNNRKISYDYKKKQRKKRIYLDDNNFSSKLISSITTKKINQEKNNNKKDIKQKKMLVFEFNIDNSKFNKKNQNSKGNNTDTNSFIQKLGENAVKLISTKKNITIQNNSNINDISDNRPDNSNQLNNSSKIISVGVNENEEGERKINRKKIKKLELNDDEKFLYHLNIRDNTSNSLKQFVVLTSKKYIDFFK